MNLTEADLAMFARLGITADLLKRVGVERVDNRTAREKYGITGSGSRDGVVFPYFDPITGVRHTCRLRRDRPDIEGGKERKKYVAPYGDRRHLYFVSECADHIEDISVPVALVEAEKSALALTDWAIRAGRKLLAVGMGGCWGWRGRIGKAENSNGDRVDEVGPLPELLRVCGAGRKIYVLLDANCATNPKVQEARAALIRVLQKQRAQVTILDLPTLDGVNGPDDYLAVAGDEAMQKLFDGAEAGAAVLDRVSKFYGRFVRMSEAQNTITTLWTGHTHAMGAADTTPYLGITSAEKQSGKTLLLELAELLVARPWLTGRVTAAILPRKIDAQRPTLLLDESDAAFSGDKEYAEALRGVLNTGYRRGGMASCCVGQGANISFKDFCTFCPKAIAGIGKLPDTVADRSVPIRLKRKAHSESVARFRRRDVEPEAKKLRDEIVEWISARLDALRAARPLLPDELSDRQQDVSEPLLAIADAAGGDWPSKARTALIEILTSSAAEDQSLGVRLLSDIYAIFEAEGNPEQLASSELVARLIEIETSPWPEWNHRKPLSPKALASLLKKYDIAPRGTIRLGDKTAKGYDRAAFVEAWMLYLPSRAPNPGSQSSHASQRGNDAGQMYFSEPSQQGSVTDAKREDSPINTRGVTDVTDRGWGYEAAPDATEVLV